MILYQYECGNKICGHLFEEFNTPNQTKRIQCPKCKTTNVSHKIGTQKFRLIGEGFQSGHGGKKLA